MESTSQSIDTQLVLILGTCGMLLLTAAIAMFIYLYQRKLIKRKIEFQKIEDLLKQQELKTAYAMLEGQEKAHKRIAEELHDNLGSILVTLNMFADTLQKKKDPESIQLLALKISEVAQIANDATRKISHSLDSGVLKHFGLATAIEELAEALNQSQQIKVSCHVQISGQLDSEISLNIYRIVQELTNNTLKHAHATIINIDLNQIHGSINLIFEDNGIGFHPDHIETSGMGLKNLKSRVDRLDGNLSLESQTNKGTTVIIDIPLP